MGKYGKYTIYVLVVGYFLASCTGISGTSDPVLARLQHVRDTNDPLGPKAVHKLILEDVPEAPSHQVRSPSFIDPETGASVQVLRVLKDPRNLPLDRFINYRVGEGRVKQPLFWRLKDISLSDEHRVSSVRFLKEKHMGVNVYVRVQAPPDTSISDPFSPLKELKPRDELKTGEYLLSYFSPLAVNGKEDLVCAIPEYALGVAPYKIGSSEAPGSTIVYDPGEYGPLKPWYIPQASLSPGEVREGWLLCLAPEGSIEDVWLQWRRLEIVSKEGDDLVIQRKYQVAWLPAPIRAPGEYGTLRDIKIQAYDILPDEKDSIKLTTDVPVTVVGGGIANTQMYRAKPFWEGTREDLSDPTVETWLRLFVRVVMPESQGELIWEKDQIDLSNVYIRVYTEPGGEEIALSNRRDIWFSSYREVYGSQPMENGFWIEIMLEETVEELNNVWISLEKDNGDSFGGHDSYGLPVFVWKVDLFDASDPDGIADKMCAIAKCVEGGAIIDDLGNDKGPDHGVPALCLGEIGAGITVTEIRFEDWNDGFEQSLYGSFSKGMDFGGFRDVFAGLSLVPGIRYPNDNGGLSIGYRNGAGKYVLMGSSKVVRFGKAGDYTSFALVVHGPHEIRSIEEGFGLSASPPLGVAQRDLFVYLEPGGPLWQASCSIVP